MLSSLRPETTAPENFRQSKLGLGSSISQQNLRSSVHTAQSSVLSPSGFGNTGDLGPLRSTKKAPPKMAINDEYHTDDQASKGTAQMS